PGENPNENNGGLIPTHHNTSQHITTEREEARSHRSRSSPLPENFLPIDLSDSNRGEFEKFKSYHLARDSRFANRSLACRNWQTKSTTEETEERRVQEKTCVMPSANLTNLPEARLRSVSPETLASAAKRLLSFYPNCQPHDPREFLAGIVKIFRDYSVEAVFAI